MFHPKTAAVRVKVSGVISKPMIGLNPKMYTELPIQGIIAARISKTVWDLFSFGNFSVAWMRNSVAVAIQI